MQAAYPLTPALDYYQSRIGAPWTYCEWGGLKWQNFVDSRGSTAIAVHQHLHMWVNRETQREIMLPMQFRSDNFAELPEGDIQHMVPVENMNTNVSETIKRLKLRCTSGDGASRRIFAMANCGSLPTSGCSWTALTWKVRYKLVRDRPD